MKLHRRFLHLTLVCAMCAVLAGCLFKPTTVATRSFVLIPIPAGETKAATGQVAVGVGPVKVPPYLLRSSIAYRKSANEISYLESSLWAEPLDKSIQRALGANLANLLPTDQIRLSAWQRTEVAVAVYVNVEQFDVDAQGRGTLIAWWRIVSPDGGRVLRSGQSRLTRSSAAKGGIPEIWVATLNELTTEFSQALAQVIRECVPAAAAAKPPQAQ
jgi:uncharacterized lipoprotein YmbA